MDNAAMRGLFGRLGLSQSAAHFVVHDQSINELMILKRLSDDEIESLCRICRKPGGQIINPANAGDPALPAVINNPGISVAALHQENIKLAAFYLRLMSNVSRVCDFADVTLVNIETARNYKVEIEAHENLKLTDAPTLKPQKVFEFFTELREFAFDMVGSVSKVPLAYVIQNLHSGPQVVRLHHSIMNWLHVPLSIRLHQMEPVLWPITSLLTALSSGRCCTKSVMVHCTIVTSVNTNSHEMVVLPSSLCIQRC